MGGEKGGQGLSGGKGVAMFVRGGRMWLLIMVRMMLLAIVAVDVMVMLPEVVVVEGMTTKMVRRMGMMVLLLITMMVLALAKLGRLIRMAEMML